MPPLEPIHGSQITNLAMRETHAVEKFAGAVAVPDLDACFREREEGCAAGDEPEEFGDDGAEEDAFCGEEGEDGGVGVWVGGGGVGVGMGEGEAQGERGEEGECACACSGGEGVSVRVWEGGREGGLPVWTVFAVGEDGAD